MRTRTRTTSVSIQHDNRGWRGSQVGTTTCNREVTLDEVIRTHWAGNYPTPTETSRDLVTTMVDTVTPNYAKKRKSGEILATNFMTRETYHKVPPLTTKRFYSIASYCFYKTNPCNGKDWSSTSTSMGTKEINVNAVTKPTALFSSSEMNAIRAEAMAKLRSQGMDYLTTMVELRQTLAMIAGARRRLIDLVTKMVNTLRRKGIRPRTWSQFLDEIGGAWLEGRFGWRILYYDLLAIVRYIENVRNDSKLIVGRASASRSKTFTSSYGDQHVIEEVKVGYPGLIDYSIPGASSLLNTTWEVIPFSLVVDMFFDVQSLVISLSGSTANVKEYPQAAFETRTLRRYGNVQAERPPPPPGWGAIYFNEPSVISQFHEIKSRSLIGEPKIGLPAFRLNLGGFKPLDLAFLVRIIVGRIT